MLTYDRFKLQTGFMQKTCQACKQIFDFSDWDRKLLDEISPVINNQKISIPDPTRCPDCRQRRRLVSRNERNLFYTKCGRSGKKMLSLYPPNTKYNVFRI